MNPFAGLVLLATLPYSQLWYSLPLIVTISLVYGATRDEQMWPILQHALRAAIWFVGFMAIIFGILYVVSWSL